MGKDKKDKSGIASFKTKDTLKEDDVRLTKELETLERRYCEVYRPVQQLAVTYESCKDHFALQRYGDLKTMIKSCVTDENLQKAAQYSSAGHVEMGKTASLLQACKQLSAGVSEGTARDEISQLHKAELVKDIEEKKKRKDQLEKKFLRAHNRLEKLKRDYEESKQYVPTKRYMVMKEIIKPLIRDTALKVEA